MNCSILYSFIGGLVGYCLGKWLLNYLLPPKEFKESLEDFDNNNTVPIETVFESDKSE